MSRSRNSLLLLGSGEGLLSLQPLEDPSHPLRLKLLDASSNPSLTPLEKQPGRVNYLRGRDPSGWKQGVPTYSKIRYQGVYPGIDLIFYGTPRQLEFDFVLAPESDPDQIKMRLNRPFAVDSRGDLVIQNPWGSIRLLRPIAYQNQGEARLEVACRYAKISEREFGFQLGAWDRSRPLVVDPVVVFSSFLGGDEADVASAVALDGDGNIYLAGTTAALNFPTSPGALQEDPAQGSDLFVSKLSPDGASLLYSTYLGGQGEDQPVALAVDAAGSVYLTGVTDSSDFPVMEGVLQEELGGGINDAFVARLDASGASLEYATYLGGNRDDIGQAIAVDADGNAFVAGRTRSTDFPLVGEIQDSFRGGLSDAFVAKIDPRGTTLIRSTYLGGTRSDEATAIALDPEGNTVVAGFTDSLNFPLVEPFQASNGGINDIFISKIDLEGSATLFSTYLGGALNDLASAAAVDAAGDIFLTGESNGPDYPLENPLQTRLAGGRDVIVTKFAGDGSGLIYSTYLGGRGTDTAFSIALDAQGCAYIAGATTSSDFPTQGTLLVDPEGADAFLARLSADGSTLSYSTYLGGDRFEFATGLAIDSSGNAIVVGQVDQPGFPVLSAFQNDFGGKGVYRSPNGSQAWLASGSGLSNVEVASLAFDPQGRNTAYAGTLGDGVFKSTNGGQSWQASGLEDEQVLSLAVHPGDSDILYAGTSRGIFISRDGGESWQQAEDFLPAFTAFQTLAIDPRQPSTVYAASNGRGVFKTTDGGELWRAINNGLDSQGQMVTSLAVDPRNSSRLFLSTPTEVFASNDAGIQWEAVEADLSNFFSLSGLLIRPNDSAVFAAGVSDTPVPDEFCEFNPPCNNFVLRTSDGGTNWDAFVVGGAVSDLALDPVAGSTLYAATRDAGIFKSTDGGENWSASSQGLGSRNVSALAVNQINPSLLLAGTQSGSDAFLAKVSPLQIFYFPQVGEGTAGNVRFQTTLILVNTGLETEARVEFFRSSGQPLSVMLGNLGMGSSFDIVLGAGEAFSAQTLGEGDLGVGYARVTTGVDVGGTAVFTRSEADSGVILYEAGVPASTGLSSDFLLFLDSLQANDTGLALVAAAPEELDGDQDVRVDLDLFDKDSNQIARSEMLLPNGAHRSQFIPELFPDISAQVAEMRGVLRIGADRPVAAVSLRQKDDVALSFPDEVETLTSLPVVGNNALTDVLYFPQIADGEVIIPPGVAADDRFQTSLVLLNGGAATALATIEFFDQVGDPLELTLGDLGTDSLFQVLIQPGRFFFAQTPGASNLKIGYARVTSSSIGLGGTAIFAQSDIDSGVILLEAGVPASRLLREFSLFVDTLGVRNTGLALVNPSSEQEAQLTFRLYDKSFNLIGESMMRLNPGQHLPRFIDQLLPDVAAQAREMEGVLTVESDIGLAAVTLRQNADMDRPFPQTVPTLATFPVIPGRAR